MFILLFSSGWIPEEQIHHYVDSKDRFMITNRLPKGFKEAVEAIEDVIKTLPQVMCATAIKEASLLLNYYFVFDNNISGEGLGC